MLILRRLHRFEELSEFFLLEETSSRIDFGGLELEPFALAQQEGMLDLTLEMSETLGSLKGVVKYNPDLFEAGTVHRMVGHFQTLLEGIVANPNQHISTLPLLTEALQHQLLVEWNATQTDYPRHSCIHQLFEAQVKRTPDAVAVVFDLDQLTYQELNCRANQVAHYLRSLGVGKEVLVGICMERSLFMVVGLLGILKAGGAYVAIDSTYPQERNAFILEDAQVSVILTQQQLVESLPKHRAHVVCLDSALQYASQSEDNPTSEAKPTNLAYAIYTSGSTGKPKGVAIEHRSTVTLLNWATEVFTPEQIAGVLASTSICFDLSVFELFVPISWGGKAIIAKNALHLPSLPQAKNVTLINTVPSATLELLRVNGIPDGVRTVNLAGEPLPNQIVQQLYQQHAVKQVFNLYGPSEDTTYSTFALTKKGASKSPPIGRPIANTQIYLLDAQMQPVPIGVSGELYIGGDGLARGYLNRPDLTAARFIPNPFSDRSRSGDRLYKTGDLARYLPDGNIEFLGRIDHQVKVRGFRIELGEIEAALSQHPAVREAVVLASEDVPGEKRLVAYVVSHQEQAPTSSEMRRFLKQQLPEYMVPSAFVTLKTLPLTPNGKVDRRALPIPDQIRQPEETFVAPRNELELQLTKIWEKVLGIQPIAVRDNFFELGGHSLLAVRLFSAIEQAFGSKLPLATLFKAPTIEQLANILRSKGCDAPRESLVPLQPCGTKPPLFCIYGILLYHDLARNLGADQPVYGVYIQDEVDLLKAGRLEKQQSALISVTELATLYLKKIRTLQPECPYFLAGESFGGLVAFEMAQQLHLQGEKVALVALLDTVAPGSLKKMPWQQRVSLHLRYLLQ